MPITTYSSRSFNQAVSSAKKACEEGPVYITDRGKPAHVLLTYEAYKKLTDTRRNIQDSLVYPEAAEIAFEPGGIDIEFRDIDFS